MLASGIKDGALSVFCRFTSLGCAYFCCFCAACECIDAWIKLPLHDITMPILMPDSGKRPEGNKFCDVFREGKRLFDMLTEDYCGMQHAYALVLNESSLLLETAICIRGEVRCVVLKEYR